MFRIMIIHASVTSSLGNYATVQFSTAPNTCIFTCTLQHTQYKI
jgi:hypothetical protein